ncbi:hypothetical protein KEM56_003220 [Ascosphaera pollenicola]|nr:hypothetical protein KEM56_003220 [Ascosphaera pollenicola]
MDEQEQATKPTATAAFPPPPPFWKHFTRANIARFEGFQRSQTETETVTVTDINRLRESIPFDLRYLVPPPLPDDTYQLFGEAQEVNANLPSLPSQSIAQLFQDPSPQDYPFWLRTSAKYLLFNFLELTALLASPQASDSEGKVEDLRVLMLNAHHLLNAYRAHQARESVIGLLERQIAVSRGEVHTYTPLRSTIQ